MSVEQFVRSRVAPVTPFNQSLARLQSYNPILLLSSPLAPPAIPRACFATVTSDSSTTDHKKCRFEQKKAIFSALCENAALLLTIIMLPMPFSTPYRCGSAVGSLDVGFNISNLTFCAYGIQNFGPHPLSSLHRCRSY